MTRLFLVSVLAISLAACGGKDDEKKTDDTRAEGDVKKDEGGTAPAANPGTTDTKVDTDTAVAPAGAPAVPDTAPAAGSVDFSGVMKDMVGIVKDMAKVVDGAGGDCGKMATGMDKLMTANKSKLEAAKKFNEEIQAKVKADPAAAQKLMAELGPVMGEMMQSAMKLQTAMTKCVNDPMMLKVAEKWKQYQ